MPPIPPPIEPAAGVIFENLNAPMQELIDQRAAARANKDWATADKLRKELQALGWQSQDDKL